MQRHQSTTPFLMIVVLMLLVGLSACQPGAMTAATPKTGDSGPAQPGAPQTSIPTIVSAAQLPAAPGGFNLPDPAAGLSGLDNYHQALTVQMRGTLKGQPYERSLATERDVLGADRSLHVTSKVGSSTTDFRSIRLDGYLYTQNKPDQPCGAVTGEAAVEQPLENPARQLPGLYGLDQPTDETTGGQAAKHYTFDQRAVPMQAGKNGTAAGELFLSADGQTVLQYTLTIEVKDGDFKGTRTFTYRLEPGAVKAIRLPDACQPVLTGFPEMPGAQNQIRKPAFIRYTVAAQPAQVRDFYLAALPELGWQPLPGTSAAGSPDAGQPAANTSPDDPLVLSFGKANADGSGLVAVIRAAPQDGALQVIVQTTHTKQAVKVDVFDSLPPAEDGDTQPEPPDSPETGAVLPDLPLYPGAKVIIQNESMLAIDSTDALDTLIAYYTGQLETSGWTKTQDNSASGSTIQNWEKEGITVMVAFTRQDGKTRVILKAVAAQ